MKSQLQNSRLVDEFRAVSSQLNVVVPGELSICQSFADFEWSPNECTTSEEFFARIDREPAFTVKGSMRWLAFARIQGEIRYYAAPLFQGGAGYWSDPERRTALDAERDYSELAVLANVVDAVHLSVAYLGGAALETIPVPRLPAVRGYIKRSKTSTASNSGAKNVKGFVVGEFVVGEFAINRRGGR